MYTTNKDGNNPIMSTKVNDGYPCAYPEQRTSDAIYYPLERSKYIPRCEKPDQRYEQLGGEPISDEFTV